MLKEPFPVVGGYDLAHYLPSNELNLLECDHLDVQEHNHFHLSITIIIGRRAKRIKVMEPNGE